MVRAKSSRQNPAVWPQCSPDRADQRPERLPPRKSPPERSGSGPRKAGWRKIFRQRICSKLDPSQAMKALARHHRPLADSNGTQIHGVGLTRMLPWNSPSRIWRLAETRSWRRPWICFPLPDLNRSSCATHSPIRDFFPAASSKCQPGDRAGSYQPPKQPQCSLAFSPELRERPVEPAFPAWISNSLSKFAPSPGRETPHPPPSKAGNLC